ncbi:MAG: HAMP domain-containing sensor histidine kinase [Pseudomonadales bacterium]
MKRTGLRAKLVRVFAIQVGIVSIATLVGIYVANTLIVDLILREGLETEAQYYWDRYAANPDASLPDTSNMRSYMAVGGDLHTVPDYLRDMPADGQVRSVEDDTKLVHVSARGDHVLYLVWAKAQIYNIAFFFGIVPLTVVLLVIYGLAFLAYRLSQRAISPIIRLARYLDEFDFEQSRERSIDVDLGGLREIADAEVAAMIEALDAFNQRLNAFVEREREFTRDAGHELRTPVSVFKGSLDLLEQNSDRPRAEQNALRRMRRTVEDMEALLETLLLLARGNEVETPKEDIVVNDLVAAQVDLLQPLAERAGNSVTLHENAELRVRAPAKVVEIVIGNLVRNAINYTQGGKVDITITATGVRVEDTGVGMSREQLANAFEPFYRADESRGLTRGHGLGLSIVKRLVRQFGWGISAHSRPGEGTAMEVRFVPVT